LAIDTVFSYAFFVKVSVKVIRIFFVLSVANAADLQKHPKDDKPLHFNYLQLLGMITLEPSVVSATIGALM
jgi:hypothetical protein